jgi:hypothetical protein
VKKELSTTADAGGGESIFDYEIEAKKKIVLAFLQWTYVNPFSIKKLENQYHCHVPSKAPLYNLNACIKGTV